MDTKLAAAAEFTITRDFEAPRALVWKAWTDPARLARWFGPRGFAYPDVALDLRPGGAWRIVMRGPDGAEYPIRGIVREVVPPERLVMSGDTAGHPKAWFDRLNECHGTGETLPVPRFVWTVTFEDLGAKTRLTVRTDFESAAVRDALVRMGMNEGWSESLDKLAESLSES